MIRIVDILSGLPASLAFSSGVPTVILRHPSQRLMPGTVTNDNFLCCKVLVYFAGIVHFHQQKIGIRWKYLQNKRKSYSSLLPAYSLCCKMDANPFLRFHGCFLGISGLSPA